VPLERFRGSFGSAVAWKAAEVDSVRCEAADRCTVVVKITHLPIMFRNRLGAIESAVDETWLLEGGQWWLPYRP